MDLVSERPGEPTVSLSIRISREAARDLRALCGSQRMLGRQVEQMIALAVERRLMRKQLRAALVALDDD